MRSSNKVFKSGIVVKTEDTNVCHIFINFTLLILSNLATYQSKPGIPLTVNVLNSECNAVLTPVTVTLLYIGLSLQ